MAISSKLGTIGTIGTDVKPSGTTKTGKEDGL